ncbi:sensor histidine kinase [Chitinophaga qingshengii]|uniref:histidine kinase n=1 Tax=Chitinophaga qingshengii TaxID=1569794 RepID=A0ABR7TGT4_9BACT|nr:hybrid sensor histidine kinase/response regulator [Chitinophaga qingshengii]MBC9929690.1 hybrid sensor histidine kinase/response regulator [Chitinophaga qingshengii]
MINKLPPHFSILLVDDKMENLISLQRMLEGDNRRFYSATSGNEALKIVLRNNDIGLILLDVQMSEMDGFEVARLLQLNPKTRDIAIIFVTAINKDEQNVIRGFTTGAVDYLSKPLDVNVTRAKVNVFEKLYFSRLELKNVIAEKEKINKQLERFTYMVAHDLKSPLAGAISLLSMINEEDCIQQSPEIKDQMSTVLSATHHLTEMIVGILDDARQTNNADIAELVDVNLLITDITRLLFPPAHIRIHTEGPLPVVTARRLKLQRIFQNLLSNAIKYNDKTDGRIAVGVADQGEFYEFYVKDNGPGLQQRDTDRVFRLFERLDYHGDEEGSGIGLNIFKMLVEEQGGKVWVTSEPGQGSTFYFLWRKT